LKSSALTGQYQETHSANNNITKGYLPEMYSFVRWSETQKLIVVANFSTLKKSQFDLIIPKEIIRKWNLKDGKYTIVDQLYLNRQLTLNVTNGQGKVKIKIKPSESFIYELKY
jgi:hypothetical protein